MTDKIPKVFLSYKWQDHKHNAWVEKLCSDLRSKYRIDVQLDKFEVDLGESFSDYMTSRIARDSDAMLFVITPAAVEAVDYTHLGGVHFEMQLANARRLREPSFKIIGIYREGDQNTAYLYDHRYIDFRDDCIYEDNIHVLANSLLNKKRKPVLQTSFEKHVKDLQAVEVLNDGEMGDIEIFINNISDISKESLESQLLAVIKDNEINIFSKVIAGNTLALLGDPRIDSKRMIVVPEGKFIMGVDGEGAESPKREVYINQFEISKYPITNIEYSLFLSNNNGHMYPEDWIEGKIPHGKENHPVTGVSWFDAVAYATWLSKITGDNYRLPTEAEWEKAARSSDMRKYPWGNEENKYKCNNFELNIKSTSPVGIFTDGKSHYGISDMAGNVWEWCEDWYESSIYKKGDNYNPKGPIDGVSRVIRGGSWMNILVVARCTYRHTELPNTRNNLSGFRLIRQSCKGL